MTPDDPTEVLSKLSAAGKDVVGFDTEFYAPPMPGKKGKRASLNMHSPQCELVGASFAFQDGSDYYIDRKQPGFQDVLKAAEANVVVAHLAKAEMLSTGHTYTQAHDSLLAAWLLGYDDLGLKALVGREDTFTKMAAGRDVREIPYSDIAPYAREDARNTLDLHLRFQPLLEAEGLAEAYQLERDVLQALVAMERRGMPVATEELLRIGQACAAEVAAVEDDWYWEWPDVSITSPMQIRDYFYPEHWDPGLSEETKKGVVKVDKHALAKHAAHGRTAEGRLAAELKQRHGVAFKLQGTYTKPLIAIASSSRDGYIHPNFNQHIAETGRLSCSNPNLQNIPKRGEFGDMLRKAFRAPAGHRIVVADYSQIEIRMLAHFSGPGAMRSALATGADPYGIIMERLRIERDPSKIVLLAILYGSKGYSIAKALRVPEKKGRQYVRMFRAKFPEIAQLQDKAIRRAEARGFVRTLCGRKRRINKNHPGSQRKALNSVLQGGAADINKWALVEAHRRGLPIVCNVHDEMLAMPLADDAAEVAQELREAMEGVYKLDGVDLVAEPGEGASWYEAK